MTAMLSKLPARVQKKIAVSGDGCWEWTAYKKTSGYGQVWAEGRLDYSHRFVYETLVGPIPDGLAIDHLCQNRGCCNPDHLEAVTTDQNNLRAIIAEARKIAGAEGYSFAMRLAAREIELVTDGVVARGISRDDALAIRRELRRAMRALQELELCTRPEMDRAITAQEMGPAAAEIR